MLSGCSLYETDDWRDDGDIPDTVSGMRPVYDRVEAYEVYSDVVRAVTNAINTFAVGTRLYVVDADLGVHVVDNADPNAPRQLGFIRIPGVRTARVDAGFLYANNYEDFVTVDIRDLDNARVVDRQEDFYESLPASPPGYRGFFECYDPALGPLLGWETALLEEPRCRS